MAFMAFLIFLFDTANQREFVFSACVNSYTQSDVFFCFVVMPL